MKKPVLKTLVLLWLLPLAAWSQEGKLLPAQGARVEGRYVVVIRGEVPPAEVAEEISEKTGSIVADVWDRALPGFLLADLSEEDAWSVAKDERILWIEEDAILDFDSTDDVPEPSGPCGEQILSKLIHDTEQKMFEHGLRSDSSQEAQSTLGLLVANARTSGAAIIWPWEACGTTGSHVQSGLTPGVYQSKPFVCDDPKEKSQAIQDLLASMGFTQALCSGKCSTGTCSPITLRSSLTDGVDLELIEEDGLCYYKAEVHGPDGVGKFWAECDCI